MHASLARRVLPAADVRPTDCIFIYFEVHPMHATFIAICHVADGSGGCESSCGGADEEQAASAGQSLHHGLAMAMDPDGVLPEYCGTGYHDVNPRHMRGRRRGGRPVTAEEVHRPTPHPKMTNDVYLVPSFDRSDTGGGDHDGDGLGSGGATEQPGQQHPHSHHRLLSNNCSSSFCGAYNPTPSQPTSEVRDPTCEGIASGHPARAYAPHMMPSIPATPPDNDIEAASNTGSGHHSESGAGSSTGDSGRHHRSERSWA